VQALIKHIALQLPIDFGFGASGILQEIHGKNA
jgi:hypothetical protein